MKRSRLVSAALLCGLCCCLVCCLLLLRVQPDPNTLPSDGEASADSSPAGSFASVSSLPAADSREPEEVSALQQALRGKVVILDPGHGFGDVGCPIPESDLYEKDLTPVLVQKLRKTLEQDGVTVLLTHDGTHFQNAEALDTLAQSLSYDLDAYLEQLIREHSGRTPLQQADTVKAFKNGLDDNDKFSIFERSYYANLLSAEQHADLFLSVHVNANEASSSLCGFDLFSCCDTAYDPDSRALMQALGNGLQAYFPQTPLRKTAYGWEDAYAVNKYPDMPSVLLESGYATNPSDRANLQNEAWQDRFARAVADGIEQFLLG